MSDTQEFYYEPEPAESLSVDVVTAVAQAHDEDVLENGDTFVTTSTRTRSMDSSEPAISI